MNARENLPFLNLLRAVRERWMLVLVCLVVVPGVVYALTARKPDEYTATASLLFRLDNYDKTVLAGAYVEPYRDPVREGATNLRLASLSAVSRRVAERLGFDTADVDGSKTIQAATDTDVVDVSFVRQDPREAAALANAYVEEYVAYRRGSDRQQVRRALRLLQEELAQLPADETAEGEREELRAQERRLRLLMSLQTGNAQVAERAQVPEGPSGPRVKRNTVIGALAGLLLGLLLAVLFGRLDRRLRTPDEISELTGLPLLARIPESRSIRRAGGDAAGLAAEFEAFRMLRANLTYFNVDRDVRSVLITSGAPGDGKSTVAWNLAAAAAGASSVLLIEADLRKPGLAQLSGTPVPGGLGAVLASNIALDDAVTTVELDTAGPAVVTMDVLPAGPPPPNPAELLESPRMSELLAAAHEHYDFVVVDSAPATVVADAVPLIRQVSGVLIVSRLGKNTRDSLLGLTEMLENLNARTLGVVVNGIEEDVQPYYGAPTRELAGEKV